MIRAKTAAWSCTELVNSVYSGWAIAQLISSRPNLAAIEKRPAWRVCYVSNISGFCVKDAGEGKEALEPCAETSGVQNKQASDPILSGQSAQVHVSDRATQE